MRPLIVKHRLTIPVGWFEIYVQDMARAKAFYAAVFDAQFTAIETPGMQLFSFGMDDASGNIEIQKAIAAGGRVQKPKTSIGPNGHIALIIDTEGNMIGLHSMH
jgi:hypothetical protein